VASSAKLVLALFLGVSLPGSVLAQDLRGAGATFPAPLYKKWIAAYTKEVPGTKVSYAEVGSGEGVKRFLAQQVDFGASDTALTDEEITRAKDGARLIPVTAGMVVLAYNLPGAGGTLRLSREVYADIFLAKIKKWNDPRIQALNPNLRLRDRSIAVVARQDSSGTTFAFTNHLSAISPAWKAGPGTGKTVGWPGGAMLQRGNEGVAQRILVSEGALGYVEYSYAKRLGLAVATLQNKAGAYVAPSEWSGQAAFARNLKVFPANLRVFLPDPEGDASYPIVSFSWLLLHERYADAARAESLKQFVAWSLDKGQAYSSELGYVPLPPEVASLARTAVAGIR
jgi:phosphate transport system substrate-binding protein